MRARRKEKVNKKKRRTWGSAPHPATFEKVDETFKLPEPQSVRGGEPFTRNRLAALPEKDSLLQSFRQAFFKRPRTPLRPERNCYEDYI